MSFVYISVIYRYIPHMQILPMSRSRQNILKDIIAIADKMDKFDRPSPELEFAYDKLYRIIDRLDVWGAIDSPIPKLVYRFDYTSYHQCRFLASALLCPLLYAVITSTDPTSDTQFTFHTV